MCVREREREREVHPTATPRSQKRERERQHVSGVTGNNWEKKRGRIQGADLTPLAGEGLDSL